jgi:hypothetical protein
VEKTKSHGKTWSLNAERRVINNRIWQTELWHHIVKGGISNESEIDLRFYGGCIKAAGWL